MNLNPCETVTMTIPVILEFSTMLDFCGCHCKTGGALWTAF